MKRMFLSASAMLIWFVAAQAQDKARKSDDINSTEQRTALYNNGSNRYPKQRTLLNSSIYSSGYGTLSTQYSRFNHHDAMFVCAYGGWMINHKFMLGLGGYGLVTRHSVLVLILSPINKTF